MLGRGEYPHFQGGYISALALILMLPLFIFTGCAKMALPEPMPAPMPTSASAPVGSVDLSSHAMNGTTHGPESLRDPAPAFKRAPASAPRAPASAPRAPASARKPDIALYTMNMFDLAEAPSKTEATSHDGKIATEYACQYSDTSRYVFNPPGKINLSSPSIEIRLVLGRNSTDETITEGFSNDQRVESGIANTLPNMRAELSDPDKAFLIEPIDPKDQPHCMPFTTTWRWRITPLVEGKHVLYLQIIPLTSLEGNIAPGMRTVERAILVEVSGPFDYWAWVKINWGGIVGVVGTLGAGLAFLLKLRKPRKDS